MNLDKFKKNRNHTKSSRQKISDHIADLRIMVQIGSETEGELGDVKLSRYACYLIVQNGNWKQKLNV